MPNMPEFHGFHWPIPNRHGITERPDELSGKATKAGRLTSPEVKCFERSRHCKCTYGISTCIYIYTYIYIYYLCMYVYIYIYIYIMYIYIYIYYVYIYIYILIVYIYIMYIYIMYIYIYMLCVYIYIYTCVCIHRWKSPDLGLENRNQTKK